jgi:membrane-associated phospholipid phosphatase
MAAERRLAKVVWPVPLVALATALLVWGGDANLPVFQFINGTAAYLPSGGLLALTLLGNTVAGVALVSGWVRTRPRVLWAVLFALLPGMAFVRGLKLLFAMPRPPAVLGHDMMLVVGPTYRAFSFPSGHATTAFAFAAVVYCLSSRRWLRNLALALATAVALSRVLVGAHWPLDIMVGAAGGWLVGCLGAWLSLQSPWPERDFGRPVAAAIVCIAGANLLYMHYDLPTEQVVGWLLAVVALAQGLPTLFGRRPPINLESA